MSKKPIVITHFDMRFYVKDGWSKEELQQYLAPKGSIISQMAHTNLEYLSLSPYSYFDLNKLIEVGYCVRLLDKQTKLSDFDLLKSVNEG